MGGANWSRGTLLVVVGMARAVPGRTRLFIHLASWMRSIREEGVFGVCKERIVDDVVYALRFAGDCSRVSYDANSEKLPP